MLKRSLQWSTSRFWQITESRLTRNGAALCPVGKCLSIARPTSSRNCNISSEKPRNRESSIANYKSSASPPPKQPHKMFKTKKIVRQFNQNPEREGTNRIPFMPGLREMATWQDAECQNAIDSALSTGPEAVQVAFDRIRHHSSKLPSHLSAIG